jgi:hypothetical protein
MAATVRSGPLNVFGLNPCTAFAWERFTGALALSA